MHTHARKRVTLIGVLTALCLLVAFGGVAQAGKGKGKTKTAPKNSVTSKSIKNGQVKSKDLKAGAVGATQIADGAVTGAKIADGSITAADLASGSVGSAQIADGSVARGDLAPEPPYSLVGQSGQPSFGNGAEGDCLWSNAGPGLALPVNPAGFYKDSGGEVHLSGC